MKLPSFKCIQPIILTKLFNISSTLKSHLNPDKFLFVKLPNKSYFFFFCGLLKIRVDNPLLTCFFLLYHSFTQSFYLSVSVSLPLLIIISFFRLLPTQFFIISVFIFSIFLSIFYLFFHTNSISVRVSF